MADKKNIAQEVQDVVDSMANKMNPVQKELYGRVSSLAKQLSLDADGNIKQTISNFNILSDIQDELKQVVRDPKFQKNVAAINSALTDVVDMQNHFYDTKTDDFSEPKVIQAYQDQAFTDAVTSMTGAGMAENVIGHASDIVSDGVKEGQSFFEMNDALKLSILGDDEVDGKLVSYSKQILGDTLHGMARSYNSLVADKLGLKWYQYVGALKDTSRPFCIAMEDKEWIHESELAACARGNIDGRQVSLAGLMPDTNGENVVARCGGYNCAHHMTAVPAEFVPTKIRRKFEKDVTPDDDEINDDRPQHK